MAVTKIVTRRNMFHRMLVSIVVQGRVSSHDWFIGYQYLETEDSGSLFHRSGYPVQQSAVPGDFLLLDTKYRKHVRIRRAQCSGECL